MRIIVTDEADRDRHRIWMFQAERSVEYADRVNARFEVRIASLAAVPYQGRPAGRTRRRLSIADVQLVAEYRVDEDAIRILRVFHTRENREEP